MSAKSDTTDPERSWTGAKTSSRFQIRRLVIGVLVLNLIIFSPRLFMSQEEWATFLVQHRWLGLGYTMSAIIAIAYIAALNPSFKNIRALLRDRSRLKKEILSWARLLALSLVFFLLLFLPEVCGYNLEPPEDLGHLEVLWYVGSSPTWVTVHVYVRFGLIVLGFLAVFLAVFLPILWMLGRSALYLWPFFVIAFRYIPKLPAYVRPRSFLVWAQLLARQDGFAFRQVVYPAASSRILISPEMMPPVPPEGNTDHIEEIDKVIAELEASLVQ